MTRINLVDPYVLTNKQLRAEYRELPRIPNKVRKWYHGYSWTPSSFRMGSGHECFFSDKLFFLLKRHRLIKAEIARRKSLHPWRWKGSYSIDLEFTYEELAIIVPELCNDWTPSSADILISMNRLVEKIPTYSNDYLFDKPNPEVEDWELWVRMQHGLPMFSDSTSERF